MARGRVWSGAQAKDRGLIDQLGGLQQAIAAAGARAGLDAGEHGVRYIEKQLSPFEKFVVDATRNALVQSVASHVGLPRALLPARVERDLAATLKLLQPGLRPIRAVAYCFCEP